MKRPLLYLLVVSVLLAVVVGIAIVLRNQWTWFEVRVILTTLTIAAASVCGLACDVSRALRGANLLPRAGLALAIAAGGLILFGMWSDASSEIYWKTTTCVSIFAIAAAHASLLSIARVARRFRWVTMVAYQVIFGLALLISIMLIWEIDTQGMFRAVAALSILDAGLTLLIPLLHRISRSDPTTPAPLTLFAEQSVSAIDGEIEQLKKRLAQLEKLRADVMRGG